MQKPEPNPNLYLFIPGPHAVEQKYLEILRKPVTGHREKIYKKSCINLMEGLTELLGLQDQKPFVTTSHATDQFSNVAQLVGKNESVVAVNSGFFSEKAIQEMRAAGVTVHELNVEYGKTVDLNVLHDYVLHFQPAAVYITGNNTSTGTYQLKPRLRDAIGEETLLIVDEVSMMAGCNYNRNEYGVDFGFSGTQKCFMLTPGVVVGYISKRAQEKAKEAGGPKIRNLAALVESSAEGKPNATDNTSLVRALEERVYGLLKAGGVDFINTRNRELNLIYSAFLETLEEFGVRSFPERKDASPTVGCYSYDPEIIDLGEIKELMSRNSSIVKGYNGVIIDTGYPKLNEQIKGRGIVTGRVPLFGQDPDLVNTILKAQADLMQDNAKLP